MWPLPSTGGISPHPLVRVAPDPDHPGWHSWEIEGERYNRTVGKLLVRSGPRGRAQTRIFPDRHLANMNNVVHGGALMTFVDMTLFAGGYAAGVESDGVTLDCNIQFISPGELGTPLDGHVEVLRETGRLAFYRGTIEQDGRVVAAFSGTLRKIAPR